MAVLIRQTPYSDGGDAAAFPTNPDNVRADVIIIGSGGDTTNIEGEIGEEDEDADYKRVTYPIDLATVDTTTMTGKVKERLKSLVDSATDHKVNGVGPVFVWADGFMLDAVPARTSSHTVTYDTSLCNGEGRWVHNDDGDEVCTTAAQILYHELGHSILNHGDPLHPEGDAIVIENELRVAMGFEPRSTTDLDGGCTCPSECCIVATVASGSELAAPVQSLRAVRDRLLRGSRLGELFFDALFREYYRFSVAVARILARSPHARATVGRCLVEPLVLALDVSMTWLDRRDAPAATGACLFSRLRDLAPDAHLWHEARDFVDALARGAHPDLGTFEDDDLGEVASLLATGLPRSPHVLWAIVEPLRLVLDARARFDATRAQEAGAWVGARVDAWLRRIPLDAVTEEQPASALALDLALWAERPGSRQPMRRRVATTLGEVLMRRARRPAGGAG